MIGKVVEGRWGGCEWRLLLMRGEGGRGGCC